MPSKGDDHELHLIACDFTLHGAEIKYPVYYKEIIVIVDSFHMSQQCLDSYLHNVTMANPEYFQTTCTIIQQQTQWHTHVLPGCLGTLQE